MRRLQIGIAGISPSGAPTNTSFPPGTNNFKYFSTGIFESFIVDTIKSKVLLFSVSQPSFEVAIKRVAPSSSASAFFSVRRGNGGDFGAESLGKHETEMTEPSNSDNTDSLGGCTGTVSLERIVHSDTSAHHRGCHF